MPSTKCPDSVLRPIERFSTQSDIISLSEYNETQLRIDFGNPLFSALGWTNFDNSKHGRFNQPESSCISLR